MRGVRRVTIQPYLRHVPSKKRRTRLKMGSGKGEHLNIRIRASDKVLLDAICDLWGQSQSAVVTSLIVEKDRELNVDDPTGEYAEIRERRMKRPRH